jgi:hypothetical protein
MAAKNGETQHVAVPWYILGQTVPSFYKTHCGTKISDPHVWEGVQEDGFMETRRPCSKCPAGAFQVRSGR